MTSSFHPKILRVYLLNISVLCQNFVIVSLISHIYLIVITIKMHCHPWQPEQAFKWHSSCVKYEGMLYYFSGSGHRRVQCDSKTVRWLLWGSNWLNTILWQWITQVKVIGGGTQDSAVSVQQTHAVNDPRRSNWERHLIKPDCTSEAKMQSTLEFTPRMTLNNFLNVKKCDRGGAKMAWV